MLYYLVFLISVSFILTISLSSCSPGFALCSSEYLEEMLGRFMNARTKGGAKEEFEHKKQGVDEDALEYYNTKLQFYLHAYDEGERNIQEFKRSTLNGLRNIGNLLSLPD